MTDNTKTSKTPQLPLTKQKLTLLHYLECELKESKSLDEFKGKLAEIRNILELSNQVSGEVAAAEKIGWGRIRQRHNT